MCWPAGRWDTSTSWGAFGYFGLNPCRAVLSVDHGAVTQLGLKLDLTLGLMSPDDGMYAPTASFTLCRGVLRLGGACAGADGKRRSARHHARPSAVCQPG